MTLKELYDVINEEYGNRGCFISELGDKLKIPAEKANILTLSCGYSRTKRSYNVPFLEFAKDTNVQNIARYIETDAIYCLMLDDYSKPAFCSFDKCYFGDISMIASLVDDLKEDEQCAEYHVQLIKAFKEYRAGNTAVTHNVAYKDVLLPDQVLVYDKTIIKTDCNMLKHINTWDYSYYLKYEKAESEHIWIQYNGSYLRCVKACFEKLQYSDSNNENIDKFISIKFTMGFPYIISFFDETLSNKLYVVEKFFKNEDELFCDLENFKDKPDPLFTEIFNDIFGDG